MANFDGMSTAGRTVVLLGVCTVFSGLLFLAAESAVRIRAWIRHGDLQRIEETYTVDARTGLRIPVPGNVFGSIMINSAGFRSPEISLAKPKGTLRLAFLGASTTYCAEVSGNHMTWPHLVTEALAVQWPEKKFEYINAGVPGYGVASSLINLERRVRQYDPDVIVIYHATNDLSGNSFELAVERGVAKERTENQLSWPSQYSLLWYLVEKNLRILHVQRRSKDSSVKLRAHPEELLGPFEQEILQLVETSQETAELVAPVTFSTRIRPEQSVEEQREAAVTSLYYMPYMTLEGLLQGFDAYNAAIRRVALETEAELIEAAQAIPGTEEYFVDSVHLTDAGSEVMAQTVTAALASSPRFRSLLEQLDHR